MGIPAVLVLGVIIWAVTCAFKYWYFGKMKIHYTHKLDEKVLEDIRRPSERVIEMAMKRKREPTFVNEPKVGYPFQPSKSQSKHEDADEPKNNDKTQEPKEGEGGRLPTIFEEIDLRRKQGKVKKKSGKYDKSMFEDPLTRLYRDIQEEKKLKDANK